MKKSFFGHRRITTKSTLYDKKAFNPFEMSDEDLGSLKTDMTEDLFAEWSQGQSTVSVTTFIDNFQEIIELGLITEPAMKEIFTRHGVTSKSNQMTYEQFQRCFTDVNQLCFDETYDRDLKDEGEEQEKKETTDSVETNRGGDGGPGKGFGKKPPPPPRDLFDDIPSGWTHRP